MLTRLYLWMRDSHLYIGLFLSPFVALFALSVFFVNHAREPDAHPAVTAANRLVAIPPGIEKAQGRERVTLAGEVLSQLGVTGEIDFIRYSARERRLSIPVVKPGARITVDLDLGARTATVAERRLGWWETLVYLHKSPGPHNAAIRGNWFWTRAWSATADATIWGLLFLSASGTYLWAVLRAERRTGLVLLGAGAISFAGVVYAVIA